MIDTSLQSEPAAITGPSFGRIVRYVAGYAILIAVMLVSPLFVFLPAALFHCTVRNGRRIAWMALFIGAALAGGVVIAGANAPQVTLAEANMSVAYLVALILSVALPSMAVAPMIERAESFGRVLLTAILFGAIGLGATEMAMRAGTGFSPFADQVAGARITAAKLIASYQRAGIPQDVLPAGVSPRRCGARLRAQPRSLRAAASVAGDARAARGDDPFAVSVPQSFSAGMAPVRVCDWRSVAARHRSGAARERERAGARRLSVFAAGSGDLPVVPCCHGCRIRRCSVRLRHSGRADSDRNCAAAAQHHRPVRLVF